MLEQGAGAGREIQSNCAWVASGPQDAAAASREQGLGCSLLLWRMTGVNTQIHLSGKSGFSLHFLPRLANLCSDAHSRLCGCPADG